MIIRAVDMLTNLKNWSSWDYKGYKINEDESKPIIKALENYVWHDVELEGMPKEDGHYLYKVEVIDENAYVYWTGYIQDGIDVHISVPDEIRDMYKIKSWRKIVDEGDN